MRTALSDEKEAGGDTSMSEHGTRGDPSAYSLPLSQFFAPSLPCRSVVFVSSVLSPVLPLSVSMRFTTRGNWTYVLSLLCALFSAVLPSSVRLSSSQTQSVKTSILHSLTNDISYGMRVVWHRIWYIKTYNWHSPQAKWTNFADFAVRSIVPRGRIFRRHHPNTASLNCFALDAYSTPAEDASETPAPSKDLHEQPVGPPPPLRPSMRNRESTS